MQKIIGVLIGVVLAVPVVAQHRSDISERHLYRFYGWTDSTGMLQKPVLRGDIGYFANATGLNNDFINTALFGGYLTESTKDKVLSRSDVSGNRAGINLEGGFVYRRPAEELLGMEDVVWEVSLRQRDFIHAGFSRDFFHLLFKGNRELTGETAMLDPTEVTAFSYQALSVGLEKRINALPLRIGGSLAFLKGSSYRDFNIHRGRIYTAEDGTYADVDVDFDYRQTYNENNYLTDMKGAGSKLDLFASYDINEQHRLSLQIRDIGFIHWPDLRNYHADTAYRYKGAEVENVVALGDEDFSDQSEPLNDTLGIEKQNEQATTWLPPRFHVSYVYKWENKRVVGGMRQWVNAHYIPRVYARLYYPVADGFYVIPGIAYGGYGTGDFELGVSKKLGSNFLFSLNFNYFEASLAPERTSGQSAYFSVSKAF